MSYNLGQERSCCSGIAECHWEPCCGILLWLTLHVFLSSVVFNFQKARIFVNCFDLQYGLKS